MKRLFLSILSVLIVVGLLASAPAVSAQSGASLEAAVDRDTLSVGETLVLELTLSTPDVSMPQLSLPPLDDFRVIGSSQSIETSLINGDWSITTKFTYQLQPVNAGDLTIPAFGLDWNGQKLTTDPISIQVSQSSSAPGTNPVPAAPQNGAVQPGSLSNQKGTHDFFIESGADKQSLYVGEAVKFILRLYNNGFSFGQPDYEPPQYVGFWHPQEPQVSQYEADGSDGTPYEVTELTTLLFPTTPGEATIDPATITTPGGFFSAGQQVQSDPISIEVKPLPEGAPTGFNGAVGQFEINATPDRLSTRLGEPVSLRVELSGSGNWGTLADPEWPADQNWRIYNQETLSNSDIEFGRLTGSREYELLWTPLVEGKITIPAVQYSFFDPSTGQYQTISTQPQTIDVTPGDPALASAQPQDTAAANPPALSEKAASLPIKAAQASFTSSTGPLFQRTGFLLLFLLPLGLVIGDLALSLRTKYLTTHAADLRRSKAYKRARHQLKRIPRRANVQMEAARILLVYLEDLIQQPLAGLSHSALAVVLQANHFSPELARRVIETLFSGEASEYTPRTEASYEQVVGSAMILLDDLEKNRS